MSLRKTLTPVTEQMKSLKSSMSLSNAELHVISLALADRVNTLLSRADGMQDGTGKDLTIEAAKTAERIKRKIEDSL